MNSNSAATGKPPLPVLISGGLPPVPAKLVKKIHDGSIVEMAELLTAPFVSPPMKLMTKEPATGKHLRKSRT